MDGDGIPYRTIPGDGMPAYFTRGSGHNDRGQYSERPDDYVNNVERLARKFETARQLRAAAGDRRETRGAGRHHRLRHHAFCDQGKPRPADAAREGSPTAYLRLRAYPFTDMWPTFIGRHDRVYVVEQNRDGQMFSLMRMELDPGAHGQAPQRSSLQRSADRRPFGDR